MAPLKLTRNHIDVSVHFHAQMAFRPGKDSSPTLSSFPIELQT